ncbi:hypothetical protein AB0K48_44090, partial [Nonomuraea sp. NPDC055795]
VRDRPARRRPRRAHPPVPTWREELNLARRKQGLLHRQLSLLDAMQRRTHDPDRLDELFRLDHLTTRMRRHAEGLIILSGAAPGRAWRKPVPVLDIVRAAIAEVEDYARINVETMPGAALDGGAAADLTHLVAELVENASIYSSPETAVQVRGDLAATATCWRSRTVGSASAPRSTPRSTPGWPTRPSSTWPTATGSDCSSWRGWQSATGCR